MLIDSHCHLDDYEDLPDVLRRARAAGVGTLLAVGIGDGPDTMHRALEIASGQHGDGPRIFASVGIHPQEAHQATPENLARLRALAQNDPCIAIGEIGLDYYHLDNPEVRIQHEAFIAQLAIAAGAKKPVLIHLRTSELAIPAAKEKFAGHDATEDFFQIVEQHWKPTGLPGIMHCFSGSVDDAQRALALGFYLSFAGNLTYPKSVSIREAAQQAPEDRILVETDAPFLAPIPLRGQRNEPAMMTHTAAALAELRGLGPEALAELTTRNFHQLFPTTRALAQ
jgi:TatD DNase family protein